MQEQTRALRSTGLHDICGTSIDELDTLESGNQGTVDAVYWIDGQFYCGGEALTSECIARLRLEVIASVSEIRASEEAGNEEAARRSLN